MKRPIMISILGFLLLLLSVVVGAQTFTYSHHANPDDYNYTIKGANHVIWYMNYTFNEFELWSFNKTTLPIKYEAKYGYNTSGVLQNDYALMMNYTIVRTITPWFYGNTFSSRFNFSHDTATNVYIKNSNGVWFQIGGGTNGDVATTGVGLGASNIAYVFDNSYATNSQAMWYNNQWQMPTNFPNSDYNEIRFWDESLYVPVAANTSVLFTIKNEFGQYVQNARLVIKGNKSQTLVYNDTTDISGNARAELIDDYYYNVTVTKAGYQHFSGLLHVLTDTYTISIISTPNALNPFISIYNHVDLITSPSGYIYANRTIFTIDVTSDDALLGTYGINMSINGSSYANNSNILVFNFSNYTYYPGTVRYWFDYNGTNYTKIRNFIVQPFTNTSQTLTGLMDEVVDGMSTEAKFLIAILALIIVIAIMASLGVPGDFYLLGMVPVIILLLFLGIIPPVFGGIIILLSIMFLITFHKGGSSN